MATTPPLRVEFQLSQAEFVRAHRSHLRESLLTFKNLGLLTFALALGMLQMQVFGGASLALQVFAGLWCVMMAFLAWVYLALPARLYARSPRHAATQSILVEEDGLTHEKDGRKILLRWSEITRTRSDDGFYFLYTDARASLPVIIPKRALGSIDDQERFRQELLHRLGGPNTPS